jgi:hypothetical protein
VIKAVADIEVFERRMVANDVDAGPEVLDAAALDDVAAGVELDARHIAALGVDGGDRVRSDQAQIVS